MTKKELAKLLEAIDFFLNEDPDKWVDGINALFLLAHGKRWTKTMGLEDLDSINIQPRGYLQMDFKKILHKAAADAFRSRIHVPNNDGRSTDWEVYLIKLGMRLKGQESPKRCAICGMELNYCPYCEVSSR